MSKAAPKRTATGKNAGAFIVRAERAFSRAAKAVISESRRHGLAPQTWHDEKIAKAKA